MDVTEALQLAITQLDFWRTFDMLDLMSKRTSTSNKGKRPFILVLGITLLGAPCLHADTISKFALNATLQAGTATGLVALDTTSGVFTQGQIFVDALGMSFTIDSPPPYLQYQDPMDLISTVFFSDAAASFEVDVAASSFVGYAGGDLCNVNGSCFFSHYVYSQLADPFVDGVVSGGLTPVVSAPVPEGSNATLVLIGAAFTVLVRSGGQSAANTSYR